MFPRKRPSRKARKSVAEPINVKIERDRNDSDLDSAHADASDSESLAEARIVKTTTGRNDSDLDLAHAAQHGYEPTEFQVAALLSRKVTFAAQVSVYEVS